MGTNVKDERFLVKLEKTDDSVDCNAYMNIMWLSTYILQITTLGV